MAVLKVRSSGDSTWYVVGGWPSISDTNYFLDEDDMASDSATHGATQQSIKAYVDTESICKYARVTAYNAHGGSRSSGWNSYPLTTEWHDPDSIGSLNTSNYQVTLSSGYYYYHSSFCFFNNAYVSGTDSRIYDHTGAAVLDRGMHQYHYGYMNAVIIMEGAFSLSQSSAVSLQYGSCVAKATDGLGYNACTASNYGNIHWGHIVFWKLRGTQ